MPKKSKVEDKKSSSSSSSPGVGGSRTSDSGLSSKSNSNSGSGSHSSRKKTSITLGGKPGKNAAGSYKRIACIRYVRPMANNDFWGFPVQPCNRTGYQPSYYMPSCPPQYGYGYYAGEFPASRKLLIIPPRNERQYRAAKRNDDDDEEGDDKSISSDENEKETEGDSDDDDDESNAKDHKNNKTKYYHKKVSHKYPTVQWKPPINVTTSIIKVRDPTCKPRRGKVITLPCYDPCCNIPLNPYPNCCDPCSIANRLNAKLAPKAMEQKRKQSKVIASASSSSSSEKSNSKQKSSSKAKSNSKQKSNSKAKSDSKDSRAQSGSQKKDDTSK